MSRSSSRGKSPPDAIIFRAKEILVNLEKAELNADGEPPFAKGRRKRLVPDPTVHLTML